LHCDQRYHQEGRFTLNFWAPLDPAGEDFASPGLEVAPLPFVDVRDYLDPDGTGAGLLIADKYSDNAVARVFGSVFQRTNLAVGDVMVFTSWTLHKTYVPENVANSRLSAEIRLATDVIPDEMMGASQAAAGQRQAALS
jgi:hypothetical protein